MLAEHGCGHAESERGRVTSSLEAKRDQLADNYVQEQRKLYSELIPQVRHSLLFEEAIL